MPSHPDRVRRNYPKCFETGQRDELLAALKAARDLLVTSQKYAGYLAADKQGYSTTFTKHEMALLRGIASMDEIIARAEVQICIK